MTATIVSSRRLVAPFGLNGGQPGATGRQYVVRADGAVETLAGCAKADMMPGDTFVIETPGGGGFGAA
jgi:5-oxoprolinase (ATP-hydrolysing)